MTTPPQFGVAVGWLALSPIALLTNVLGIVAVCHYRRQFHGTDVAFISLFVSMAAQALLLVPIPAALSIHGQGWLYSELCSFYVWLALCARMSELLALVVMNVHWMCVLRFASGQQVYGSATAVKILTVLVWVAAAIAGMVPVLGSAFFYKYYEETVARRADDGGGFVVTGECTFLPQGIGTSFMLFFIVATLAALLLSLVASADTLLVYRHMRRTALQKYQADRFYLPPASSSSSSSPVEGVTSASATPLEEAELSSNNHGGGASSVGLNGSVVVDRSHPSEETGLDSSTSPTALSEHSEDSRNPYRQGGEGGFVGGGAGGVRAAGGGANSAADVVVGPSVKSGVAKGVPPTVHARYHELNLSAELCRAVLFFTLLAGLINHLPFVLLQFVQLVHEVDRHTAETTVLFLTLIQSLILPHVLWAVSRRYRHALSYTWTVHVLRDNSAKEEESSTCTLQSFTRKVNTPGGATVKVIARSRARGPVVMVTGHGNASLHEGHPNGNAVLLHDDPPRLHHHHHPDTITRRAQYPAGASAEIVTTDLDDGMTVVTNLANHKVRYIADQPAPATATAISEAAASAAPSPSSRTTSTCSLGNPRDAGGAPQSPPSSGISRRSSQNTPSPSKSSLGSTPTRSGTKIKRTASARVEWKEQMRKKHLPNIFVNEAFQSDEATERGPRRNPPETEAEPTPTPTPSEVAQTLPDVTRVSTGDVKEGGDKKAQFEYYMSSDFHYDYLRNDSLPRMESESDGSSFQYDDHDISGILDRDHSLRSTGHLHLSTFLGEPPPPYVAADPLRPGPGPDGNPQQSRDRAPPAERAAATADLVEHSEISFPVPGEPLSAVAAELPRSDTASEEDGTSSVQSDARSEDGSGESGGEGKSRRAPPPAGTRKPPRRRGGLNLRQASRPSLQHQRTIDDSDQGDQREDTAAAPAPFADTAAETSSASAVQAQGTFYPVFAAKDSNPFLASEADLSRPGGARNPGFENGDERNGFGHSVAPDSHSPRENARDSDAVAAEETGHLRFVSSSSDAALSPVADQSDVKLSIANVTNDATSSDDVDDGDELRVRQNFPVGGDGGFRPQGQATVLGLLMEEEEQEGAGEGGDVTVLRPSLPQPQPQRAEARADSAAANGLEQGDNNSHPARKPSRPLSRFGHVKSGSTRDPTPGPAEIGPQTNGYANGVPASRFPARLTKPIRFQKTESQNSNPDDRVTTPSGTAASREEKGAAAAEEGRDDGVYNNDDEGAVVVVMAGGPYDDDDDGGDRADAMITRVSSDVQPPDTAVVLDIVEGEEEDETGSTTSDRSVVLEPYHADRRPPWMDTDFDDDDGDSGAVQAKPWNPFAAAHPPYETRSSDDSSSDAFGSSFGSNAELGTIFGSRTLSNRSDYGNPFLYDHFGSAKSGDDSDSVFQTNGDADSQYPIFDEETDRGFEDALALEHVIGGNPYYGNFNRCFESIEEEPEELQLSDSVSSSALGGKGGQPAEEGDAAAAATTSAFPSQPPPTEAELHETNPFRGMRGKPKMLHRDSPFWSPSVDVYNTSLGLGSSEDDVQTSTEHQTLAAAAEEEEKEEEVANVETPLSEEAGKDSKLEPAIPAASPSTRFRLTKPSPWPSFEKNAVNPGFDTDFSPSSNGGGVVNPGDTSDGASVERLKTEVGGASSLGFSHGVNGAEEVTGEVDSARWKFSGPGVRSEGGGSKPPVAPRPALNGSEVSREGSITPSVDPVYF